MNKFLLSVLLISFSTSSFASCFCKTNETTKTYQERNKTWYGMKVRYSCQYDCTNAKGETERIEGVHSKRIVGSEKGNEIICDGTIYEERYSSATNWFYWQYVGNKSFNPQKSDSLTLKVWAEENNCR
ncbi:MAG TPA: hypothetical protein VKY27_03435 [Bacteriovoracaceae bacterium]|nr:hypothetical protein [Bacteriovoracaceae bacterium]